MQKRAPEREREGEAGSVASERVELAAQGLPQRILYSKKLLCVCLCVCVRRDVATIELSKSGRNWVRVSSSRGRGGGR